MRSPGEIHRHIDIFLFSYLLSLSHQGWYITARRIAKTISVSSPPEHNFSFCSFLIDIYLFICFYFYLLGQQQKFPGSRKHRFVANAIDIRFTGKQQRCRYIEIN